MSLIKCPECGKDNVSDSAVSCPGCGYNIQAHIIKKQKQEENDKRLQQLQIKKQLTDERKNDPMYKKRKIQMICAVISVVFLVVLVIIFAQKHKTMKAYEKDLSSVFGIALDMTIEDIIEFEAIKYGHTEYNLEQVQDGKITRLEFAPYAETSLDTRYRHHYFFCIETGLLDSISYHDNIGGDGKCKHINTIKNAVLKVSPDWDNKEYDDLFLYMNGNIDGVKCRIRYQNSKYDKDICLFIDRAE